MYIIDKSKEEFRDLPESLDKEVLLEVTKDSSGKVSGYITVLPEVLKHFAENKTTDELSEMGFDNHSTKIDWIKNRSDIAAKAPEAAI